LNPSRSRSPFYFYIVFSPELFQNNHKEEGGGRKDKEGHEKKKKKKTSGTMGCEVNVIVTAIHVIESEEEKKKVVR
jgi:hypothetical protein